MITEKEIAEKIQEVMDKKGITAYALARSAGINDQQMYSVLRMGNPKRPDYKISTLLKVLNALEIKDFNFIT